MISILGVNELMHPAKIIIISEGAEILLEKGVITLIPDANLDSAATSQGSSHGIFHNSSQPKFGVILIASYPEPTPPEIPLQTHGMS